MRIEIDNMTIVWLLNRLEFDWFTIAILQDFEFKQVLMLNLNWKKLYKNI